MYFRSITSRAIATFLVSIVCSFGSTLGNQFDSFESRVDTALTADPESAFWKAVRPIRADHDSMGVPVQRNTMTVRSRWTPHYLYLLFTCDFDSLTLKADPHPAEETNGLWNWDVAEAFIGDDFQNINRYKEFEVSPQGEWVDLDIDRGKKDSGSAAWRWNSGFRVKSRIDRGQKIWYAEMCIPWQAISRKPAQLGLQLRINLYRCAGSEPHRFLLAWRPTHTASFHEPASFGLINLSPAPSSH